jgi:hypothetical protein
MMSRKRYSVQIEIKMQLSVQVNAESLEDAIIKARDYKRHELITTVDDKDCLDWDEIEVIGAMK